MWKSKSKKGLLLLIVTGITCLTILPISVSASTPEKTVYKSILKTSDIINTSNASTRALKLETHYRTHNGYLQSRRWDIDKKRWYDPYWRNLYKL